MDNPTKDITTKQLYLKKSMNFIKKAYSEALEEKHDVLKNENNICVHEFGSNNSFTGLTLINTCIWACKNWSKNISHKSWRVYRSSLLFTAEIYQQAGLVDDASMRRITLMLSKTIGANKKDLELRTSAKKQKHLNLKDLKKIDQELNKSKSMWSAPTRLWLRAGILTGLRPIEWKTAKLIQSEKGAVLLVQNAKNTNNRANGDERNLNLNHLTSDELSIIKGHLNIVKKFNSDKEDWTNYYQGCSNLLRTKNKIAFPNRKKLPTLYSARHQFSANMKASGARPEELAALMGHATDLTAQSTYGKKVNGTRGVKPDVQENEVDSVRRNKKTEKYFTLNTCSLH